MSGVSPAVGTGGPGVDQPVPSPGESCTVHVTRHLTFPDGTEHTIERSHVWDGYTPADAHARRLRTLRDAGRDVHTKGGVITVHRDRGDWVETETLTFEEAIR